LQNPTPIVLWREIQPYVRFGPTMQAQLVRGQETAAIQSAICVATVSVLFGCGPEISRQGPSVFLIRKSGYQDTRASEYQDVRKPGYLII